VDTYVDDDEGVTYIERRRGREEKSLRIYEQPQAISKTTIS